jgi:hypothetical protein
MEIGNTKIERMDEQIGNPLDFCDVRALPLW